jgi:hypothetical protein
VSSSENTLRCGAMGTFEVAALEAVTMAPALGIYANLGLIRAGGAGSLPLRLLCTPAHCGELCVDFPRNPVGRQGVRLAVRFAHARRLPRRRPIPAKWSGPGAG